MDGPAPRTLASCQLWTHWRDYSNLAVQLLTRKDHARFMKTERKRSAKVIADELSPAEWHEVKMQYAAKMLGILQTSCLSVIKTLMCEASSKVLRDQVAWVEAGHYASLISHPMHLGTMSGNIRSGHYKLPQQLQEDLTLMFANGKLYYALDKPVLGGIIALEAQFNNMWAKRKIAEQVMAVEAAKRAHILELVIAKSEAEKEEIVQLEESNAKGISEMIENLTKDQAKALAVVEQACENMPFMEVERLFHDIQVLSACQRHAVWTMLSHHDPDLASSITSTQVDPGRAHGWSHTDEDDEDLQARLGSAHRIQKPAAPPSFGSITLEYLWTCKVAALQAVKLLVQFCTSEHVEEVASAEVEVALLVGYTSSEAGPAPPTEPCNLSCLGSPFPPPSLLDPGVTEPPDSPKAAPPAIPPSRRGRKRAAAAANKANPNTHPAPLVPGVAALSEDQPTVVPPPSSPACVRLFMTMASGTRNSKAAPNQWAQGSFDIDIDDRELKRLNAGHGPLPHGTVQNPGSGSVEEVGSPKLGPMFGLLMADDVSERPSNAAPSMCQRRPAEGDMGDEELGSP